MKTSAVILCVAAITILLVSEEASAIGRRKCRRLARRQRQLATRDDFGDAGCGGQTTRDIKGAINDVCDQGLCDDLRRKACKNAIREVLVVEVFPAECDDVPPCVPEVCTARTCRSSTDSSLSYPANCPEVCELSGFCAEAVCVPTTPSCGSGQVVDEPNCSCMDVVTPAPVATVTAAPVVTSAPTPVVTPAPSCTTAADCPSVTCSIAACTDGVCTSSQDPSCCTDSDPLAGTDSGCTATNKFCALADGSSASGGLGQSCFVCQVGGPGCPSATPVCAFSFAGFQGPVGNYGMACFKCINDGDDVDTGCTPEESICDAGPNQAGSQCIPECESNGDCGTGICSSGQCAVCARANGNYGDDTGCFGTTTVCGLSNGTPLANDGDLGEQCFVCENTAEDLDPGCDAGVCVAEAGTLGNSCATCRNTESSPTAADLGCDNATPQCVSATGAALALGGYGDICQ